MLNTKIENIAERVIKIEAKALLELSARLPEDFRKTVEKILNVKGRVILSGVGKSGHIGKKIAATLASTGTPASFVHSTEASHGDLGMVTSDDFCLLISNSGETSELSDIITHTRRFAIPMAGISSKPDSSLMKAADYKLTLPDVQEACSIGMAPTTSTAMMLAIGDALSVALMECRNFQPEDFKVFHPGGKLGAKMSKVEQLMRPLSEMAIVLEDVSIKEVILRMTEKGYGVAVIVDSNQRTKGVITDGDLRRNADNLFNQNPLDIASRDPISVCPDDLIATAVNLMETSKVYSILAVKDEKPCGLLRMHDIVHAGLA